MAETRTCSHSEHRFPAPSSKGCRKPVLGVWELFSVRQSPHHTPSIAFRHPPPPPLPSSMKEGRRNPALGVSSPHVSGLCRKAVLGVCAEWSLTDPVPASPAQQSTDCCARYRSHVYLPTREGPGSRWHGNAQTPNNGSNITNMMTLAIPKGRPPNGRRTEGRKEGCNKSWWGYIGHRPVSIGLWHRLKLQALVYDIFLQPLPYLVTS